MVRKTFSAFRMEKNVSKKLQQMLDRDELYFPLIRTFRTIYLMRWCLFFFETSLQNESTKNDGSPNVLSKNISMNVFTLQMSKISFKQTHFN